MRLGETSVAGRDRNEDSGGLGRHILEEYSVLVQSQGDHEDDLDDDGDNGEDNEAWDGASWRSILSLSRAKVTMGMKMGMNWIMMAITMKIMGPGMAPLRAMVHCTTLIEGQGDHGDYFHADSDDNIFREISSL